MWIFIHTCINILQILLNLTIGFFSFEKRQRHSVQYKTEIVTYNTCISKKWIHLISYPFLFITIQELWRQFSTDRLIKQLNEVMQGELVLIVNTLQAADDRK